MLEAGGEPSQDNPGCKSLLSSSTRAPKARRTMITFFWFFCLSLAGTFEGTGAKGYSSNLLYFKPSRVSGVQNTLFLLFFVDAVAVLGCPPAFFTRGRTYVHRQGLACTIVTWDRRSSTGDCRPNRCCCSGGDFLPRTTWAITTQGCPRDNQLPRSWSLPEVEGLSRHQNVIFLKIRGGK